MADINISIQLEISQDGKIIVPGCEPTSSLSSRTLGAYMARGGCGSALVNVTDAVAAIPGSYVKSGLNFGRGQINQKWYVLPPVGSECPCTDHEDYFEILRGLATEDIPETEEYDKCNLIGMGYCPSPGFQDTPEPPPNPYQPESSFFPGTGTLPPIPPWV